MARADSRGADDHRDYPRRLAPLGCDVRHHLPGLAGDSREVAAWAGRPGLSRLVP